MNKKILLLLPALALVLGGCNSKSNPSSPSSSTPGSEEVVAVESVTVAPAELELEEDQSAILSATVLPITVENRDVTWSSDNSNVVSVDASGKILATGKGTATITAKSDADPTKFGTCVVTVKASDFAVAKTPVLEKDFRFGAYQKNLLKRIYLNGEFAAYPRGKTTDDWNAAKKVRFEAVPEKTDRWYVTFEVSSVKKYLAMSPNHRVGLVGMTTEADTKQDGYSVELTMEHAEWAWDSENFTIYQELPEMKKASEKYDAGKYYPVTYSNYDTISGGHETQLENDFLFQFLTLKVASISGDDTVAPDDTLQLTALFPDDITDDPAWSIEPIGEAATDKVTINATSGLVSAAADAVEGDKYKVTVSAGGLSATKDIEVKDYNYGTLEAPLTVAEAKALIDAQGGTTKKAMFIKGTVKKNTEFDFTEENKYWQQVWLDGDSATTGFEGFKLGDPSTNNEWSRVFSEAGSLLDLEVVIQGKGTKYIAYTGATPVYETVDTAEPKLVKVPSYEHSSTLALNPSEGFNLVQSCYKKIAPVFETGKKDGVVWSISPVDTKVTIDQHGVVKAAADATVDAQYTITATLFSNNEVTKSIVVTVKAPGNLASAITFDFSGVAVGNYIEQSDVYTAAGTGAEHLFGVSSYYAYAGNSSTGGPQQGQGGFIRFSSSSKNGYLILTLDAKVNRVVLSAQDWKTSGSTKESKIKVNNGTEQQPNIGSAANLTFNLDSASNVIRIDCTKRALVYSIVVSYVA